MVYSLSHYGRTFYKEEFCLPGGKTRSFFIFLDLFSSRQVVHQCIHISEWAVTVRTHSKQRPPFPSTPPTCLSRAFTWADRRMEPGWVGEEKQSITPTVRLSESSRTLGLRFEESLRKIISRQETPVLLFSFRYECPQIRVLT